MDCKDAIDELNETVSELYEQKFDNVKSEFEGYLSVFEHEENILEELINQSEARGHLVSKEYYKALTESKKESLEQLEAEKAALVAALNDGVDSGAIQKGSEAWYDLCSQIDNVTQSITEGETALLEYAKTMRELDWEVFDLIQDKITNVADEAQFLIDLMDNKKLYEDNGQLTDEGKATMGMHGQKHNIYMYQSDKYAEEIKKIDAELAEEENKYNQDLWERRQELIEQQQEMILNAEDEKNAIRDMVEEGIELELDALDELIEKRNDALDSAKDLYDYQRKIAKQTAEIAALEKQLSAYAGDDSEETKAAIQQIKVDLDEARQDLEETQYEKYVEDQEKLLDELYLEYETILNERLDNIDILFAEMIGEINTDSATIDQTIRDKADEVGYTLSESMKTTWDTSSTAITNGITSVITKYGDGFTTALTTTNTALNNISQNVINMIDQLNKLAKTNITAAGKAPAAKPPKPPAQKPSKPSGGGDGTPKVGDKVKFNGGWYYYDSYGTSPAGKQHAGEYVYITNINKKGTKQYHISTGSKLGSGDLGWLTLSQISGYATGKKNLAENEVAWTQEDGREMIVRPSDGAILTPVAKGDSVLSSFASGNIWDMANNPSEFIKDNLGIGNIDAPSSNHGDVSYIQNLDKVVFNLPNVQSYGELLDAMRKDRNFERLVTSMTIGRVAGGSSLAKSKAIK